MKLPYTLIQNRFHIKNTYRSYIVTIELNENEGYLHEGMNPRPVHTYVHAVHSTGQNAGDVMCRTVYIIENIQMH